MAESLENIGVQYLTAYLLEKGHTVQRTSGTFDLLVDGKKAEVETKGKGFNL